MVSKLILFLFIGLFLKMLSFFFSLFFPQPSLILQLNFTRQLYQGSDTIWKLPSLGLIQTVGLLESKAGTRHDIFPNGNSVHFLLKIARITTFFEQYLLLFQIIRGKKYWDRKLQKDLFLTTALTREASANLL